MSTKHDRRALLKLGAATGAGLALGGLSASAKGATEQTGTLPFFEIIMKRRSVRKFKSTPIPKEHIMKILDAAHMAPTAQNQQPWKFLVIQDRNKINQLRQECVSRALENYKKQKNPSSEDLDQMREQIDKGYDGYLSAPVYFSVLVDTRSKHPSYNVKDGSLAAGYLLLAARALGYGSVFTTDSFPYEAVQKVFDIPSHYEGICFIPMGVPENWPQTPPKKKLEDLVIFEKF